MGLDSLSPLLFVINPIAGGGRARRAWAGLEGRIRQAVPRLTAVFTDCPGHAREIAAGARSSGYAGVVVFGGDGTLSEIVGGLVDNPIPIGLVAAGRGNDFARCLDLPADPAECWERIASGVHAPVDIGTFNGRPFINIAGAGLDAEVAAMANRFPRALGGLIPYVASLALTLATYRNSRIKVSSDGGCWEGRASLVAIGIGTHYGGGFNILPDASPSDGLLDVCVAGDLGKLGIMRMVPKVVRGTHVDHPLFFSWRAREVTIESERPLAVQADGEVVGTLPGSFGLIPGGLTVLGFEKENSCDIP